MSSNKITVFIEKVVAGGLGLGRLADGMVVMIPGVLPGEEVHALITKRKKRFAECSPIEILKKSDKRIEPPCPVYEDCGGCDFQHISYDEQIRLKQDILKEHLVRSHLVQSADDDIPFLQEPAGCQNQFGYRLRVRLHRDKDGDVGIYRPQSHKVVPISNCLIASEEINGVLGAMERCAPFQDLLSQTSQLEIFVSPDDGESVILLDFGRKPRAADLKLIGESILQLNGVKDIFLRVEKQGLFGSYGRVGQVKDHALIRWTLPVGQEKQVNLTIEPGGFYQVNREQNEKLMSLLLEFADLNGSEHVLDLFCGMGNFSLPMASYAGQVLGLDLQGAAMRSAKKNAEISGLDNIKFKKGGAVPEAKKFAKAGHHFDIVLLDPPRSGCKEVLPHVLDLGAERIVYISCDPATLCRDLGQLVLPGNYEIKKMCLVDMFPQTSHLETIVLLERT